MIPRLKRIVHIKLRPGQGPVTARRIRKFLEANYQLMQDRNGKEIRHG